MIDKIFLSTPTNKTRKLTLMLFDLIAFSASIILASEVKSDGFKEGYLFSFVLPIFCIVKLLVFSTFRLYDITWQYVSIQDLAKILKANLLSSGILFIMIYGIFGFYVPGLKEFPRSVLLIDFVLTLLFSSAFKISKRMYLEVMRQSVNNSLLMNTLIVGAGSSGEQLIRDFNRSKTRKFFPIGFIDDDPNKRNLYIQGVKVLGTTNELCEIIKKYKIQTILICILSVDRSFHKKIVNLAREAGVSDVKMVSTINDISNSLQVRVQDIRDIEASDLIGRQAVSINTKDIGKYINNKRVLITGAAGSIGSEIARQVVFYKPSKIGILDINESDLADLELQLKRDFPNETIKMFLCDISEDLKISQIFENFRPDVVFHAAAYKHVPVMEKFPEEAVKVNVVGTYNLTQAAIRFGVKNFILISTDKAVNPTSIMGASKRIAEYIVTSAAKTKNSSFVAVRFGNVIGSRGSALPIFIEQIKKGGPITVTHPEMKRYFMTIPEAVALVLQGAITGKSGDVFVLDMGEPIKILDLVTDLILLNNLIPDKDIKIEFTGIREGEKLFEEVLSAEEGVIKTSHEKIFKARMIQKYSPESIVELINNLKSLNGSTTKEEWMAVFKYYVPTFKGHLSLAKDEKKRVTEIVKTMKL